MAAILIDGKTKKHARAVQVIETIAFTYGSMANAAVQCILESPIYQAAESELERRQQDSTTDSKGKVLSTPTAEPA